MKFFTVHALVASLCFATCASPALSEVFRATAELSRDHSIAHGWGSSVEGTGYAFIDIDLEARTLTHLLIHVYGIFPADLATAGPGGALGAIHFHNYPQGGPNFFVQQLPGTTTRTDYGMQFELENWLFEDPLVGAERGLTAQFVIDEIVAGNAYIGLHTSHTLCSQNQRGGHNGSCAAPGTALSGHVSFQDFTD